MAFQNSVRQTASVSPMKVKRPSADFSSARPSAFSYQMRPRPVSGLSIAMTMIRPVNGQRESISGSRERSSSVFAFFRR